MTIYLCSLASRIAWCLQSCESREGDLALCLAAWCLVEEVTMVCFEQVAPLWCCLLVFFWGGRAKNHPSKEKEKKAPATNYTI